MPMTTRAELVADVVAARLAFTAATDALNARITQDAAEATARGATSIVATIDPATNTRYLIVAATTEPGMSNVLLPDYAAGDAGGYTATEPAP